MSERTFIIIGASLTGAKAAETLREQGFDGRVLLLGAERERPYERPPLSKDYLRGESERAGAYVHDEGFYAEHEIELRTGVTVEAIDLAGAEVTLEGGERIAYEKLLLATGAQPREIEIPGAELDGICYLRTFEDCDELRQRLDRGGKAAVVGAGWIGSEFAASARSRGLEVTVIDPLKLPNERIFGTEIGEFYRDVHLKHGVELLLGEAVSSFAGDSAVKQVRTSSGKTVDCDFVVVGIGAVPRTQLAQDAKLKVANGIVVNESLESSAHNVFAAGDVARATHPFYGEQIRVEHWSNALNQGPAAARAMLGQDASYDDIPYFFSDQYDVGMEYSGFATEWDEVVFRGDRSAGEFIAFWTRGGKVLAGMNVNVWDVNEQIKALIRSGKQVSAEALADADTSLESLA